MPGQRIKFSAHKAEDMTAPTISATPKKALDQRATSRHDNAVGGSCKWCASYAFYRAIGEPVR
jgi:hypothetical protein